MPVSECHICSCPKDWSVILGSIPKILHATDRAWLLSQHLRMLPVVSLGWACVCTSGQRLLTVHRLAAVHKDALWLLRSSCISSTLSLPLCSQLGNWSGLQNIFWHLMFQETQFGHTVDLTWKRKLGGKSLAWWTLVVNSAARQTACLQKMSSITAICSSNLCVTRLWTPIKVKLNVWNLILTIYKWVVYRFQGATVAVCLVITKNKYLTQKKKNQPKQT